MKRCFLLYVNSIFVLVYRGLGYFLSIVDCGRNSCRDLNVAPYLSLKRMFERMEVTIMFLDMSEDVLTLVFHACAESGVGEVSHRMKQVKRGRGTRRLEDIH